MEHSYEAGTKVYIKNQGHMTKMAAMAIFFFGTRRLMVLKLDIKHQGEELYKVYINHEPGVTLTYFTARST